MYVTPRDTVVSLLVGSLLCVLSSQEARASDPPPTYVTVTVSPTTLTLCDGETGSLTAVGDPLGGVYTWSSANTAVATVSGSGSSATVTAQGGGQTTITVTYTESGESAQDTATIDVAEILSVDVDGIDSHTEEFTGNHFVSVKGQPGDVRLQATLVNGDCNKVTWEGAIEDDADPCEAYVERSSSKKVDVKLKYNGRVCWEGTVWVVWATMTQSPASFTFSTPTGIVTTGDGSSGLGMGIQLNTHTFTATIQPSTIANSPPVNGDKPDLTGNGTNVPSGTDKNTLTNLAFSGGVNKRWDISRRFRAKIVNPHLFTKNQLIKVNGDFYNGQSPTGQATHIPENYYADTTVGNDDSTTTDPEDNDPYNSPNTGKLTGQDAPIAPMRNSTGANGNTYEERFHFQEFARLMLNTNAGANKWYVISDPLNWKVHFKFKRASGVWTNNGSVGALNNTGF